MKKVLFMSFVIVVLAVGSGFAQMEPGMMDHDMMMGGAAQPETAVPCQPDRDRIGSCIMGGCGMGHGMMGGCGMGHGMMGGCGMGHGMMGGCGMGHGMMGDCGMGHGMMGGYGKGHGMMECEKFKDHEKFLDETVDLRRQLHNKMFDYGEAVRNPETEKESIMKLENEISDIKKKIHEKAAR